ncbi:hypothetical protein IGI37_003763 [Enterococcus sp. AZ194]|uniref:helix-turn-helix domain-containing protein n=1 Tax=Enterococcus sp. AZ194 TaxID=2774629 RepID=UPI003F2702E8
MYGQLMKEIRKAKGFTQKEVYTGIVSKTFYSDFEAGKYSVEITKFEGLLSNLGLSLDEIGCFAEKQEESQQIKLTHEIDQLYNTGKFEELYQVYETYKYDRNVALRYAAMRAYLLVLITNNNFYQFSREPLSEIVQTIENSKMWTKKEIALGKLILLSLSEKDKINAEQIYQRLLRELEKYQSYERRFYYEEFGDIHFDYIQSLLVTNQIEKSQEALTSYTEGIQQADNLHLSVQLMFITYLVHLYTAYPEYKIKMAEYLKGLDCIKTSETHFYTIIFQIHQEKARSYYERYCVK